MRATPMLLLAFLAIGPGSAFAGSGPKTKALDHDHGKSEKQEYKSANKSFKQHLKEERAECKHHRHTVACNDLKERQRIEKRQFKTGERTVQGAEASKRG